MGNAHKNRPKSTEYHVYDEKKTHTLPDIRPIWMENFTLEFPLTDNVLFCQRPFENRKGLKCQIFVGVYFGLF